MVREKVAVPVADGEAAAVPVPDAEAAAAEAFAAAVPVPDGEAAAAVPVPDAEAAAAEAFAAAVVKTMLPSSVPISVCGLREAQILTVKLAPGSLIKVCTVAAKDASALIVLLERQIVRSGWKVLHEDLRALEALGVSYLLASTAIATHHPVISDNRVSSTNKHRYLPAFKEWSLLFEDAAAHVPSIGAFNFSEEAKKISKLVRKVVVKGLNNRSLDLLRPRLDQIGEGLLDLMSCTVNFPVTLKEMKAEEKKACKAERKRRRKAVARMAAAAPIRVGAVVSIPSAAAISAGAAALVPSTVAIQIWNLRAAHTLSLTLVPGSTVKVMAIYPKHAMALYMLLSEQVSWIVSQDDLHGLNHVGASYMLLDTALETHVGIFSTLTRRELAENKGYCVAFNDWAKEFRSRAVAVPSSGAYDFTSAAAELCKCIQKLLVEVADCSRAEDGFHENLAQLKTMMQSLMNATVFF